MFSVPRPILVVLAFVLGLLAGGAHASVVISGTRVIFPGGDREVTIKMTNEGESPSLVQTWMDRGDPRSMPDEVQVPFILTPPLFRMEPKKGQTLRMVFTGEDLPQDKESIFYFNVLEVPPRAAPPEAGGGQMQIAFRNRLKVFYRPKGLSMKAVEAPTKIQWEVVPGDGGANVLQATNPTPYYISFSGVTVDVDGKSYSYEQGNMVDPGGKAKFPMKGLPAVPSKDLKIKFTTVNDYGANAEGHYPSDK